jgi:hypothetical protein
MAQTGIYGPATFQRNITLANLVLTLDAAGVAPVVTKDKGLIVSTVVAAGSEWTVTLKDTYVNGVDISGFAISESGAQNLTVEIVLVTNNSIRFQLYDVTGAAYVLGDATAYISLALAA